MRRRSFFLFFCVLYNLAFVGCALLNDTLSLQLLLILLGLGWLCLGLVSLIVWACHFRDLERRSWEPFAVHFVAVVLAVLAQSVSEPLAWTLKKSVMQRAAERITREHPQDGDAPLLPGERWVLSRKEDHRVDVRRYGSNWTVLFITGHTEFNGAVGYLYSSRDVPPGQSLHGRKFLEALERKAPRWFYCYSPKGWD